MADDGDWTDANAHDPGITLVGLLVFIAARVDRNPHVEKMETAPPDVNDP